MDTEKSGCHDYKGVCMSHEAAKFWSRQKFIVELVGALFLYMCSCHYYTCKFNEEKDQMNNFEMLLITVYIFVS